MSNLDSLDNALARMYNRMWEERRNFEYDFTDTFELRFEEMLRDTASFTYPFDSLRSASIRIVESDDHRIRIYWWFNPKSGTWRSYPAILQSRNVHDQLIVQNFRIFCGEKGFPDQAFQALYHLRDSLYLVRAGGCFSTIMPFDDVFGYVLTDTGLRFADNLFMDPEGDTLRSSLIVDQLWYFKNMEKFNNTIPFVMEYDSIAKIISWPGMKNGKTGKSMNNNVWSDRDIEPSGDTFHLRFNGTYFEPSTP
ncbi:MAG: hypothetical protein AB7H80_09820 [Candidatus Kapaibacterium sp.]